MTKREMDREKETKRDKERDNIATMKCWYFEQTASEPRTPSGYKQKYQSFNM